MTMKRRFVRGHCTKRDQLRVLGAQAAGFATGSAVPGRQARAAVCATAVSRKSRPSRSPAPRATAAGCARRSPDACAWRRRRGRGRDPRSPRRSPRARRRNDGRAAGFTLSTRRRPQTTARRTAFSVSSSASSSEFCVASAITRCRRLSHASYCRQVCAARRALQAEAHLRDMRRGRVERRHARHFRLQQQARAHHFGGIGAPRDRRDVGHGVDRPAADEGALADMAPDLVLRFQHGERLAQFGAA